MKWKFIVTLLIIVLVISVGGFYFYKTSRPLHVIHNTEVKPNNTAIKPNNAEIKSEMILFYGIGCPHCVEVEAFLRSPQAKNIPIIPKEVYYHRVNLRDLIKKAQKCDAVQDGMVAIPLLWQGNNQCITGADKVMQYLNNLVKKR